MNEHVSAILLLYYHPLQKNASTIMDHVNAFESYSQFPVIQINIHLGFPNVLNNYSFSVIVLHYSLFGSLPFRLKGKSLEYVRNSKNSMIVAFFQDEHQYCPERITLINTLGIRCIYSLVEPAFHDIVYRQSTNVSQIIYYIPGYVSENMEKIGTEFFKPERSRTIDIGYRGRELPAFNGKGAFEKVNIAHRFLELSKSYSLKCDIETSESKRIYGDAWYRFLANCRGVLGVEAGVTIFDLSGDVYRAYKDLEQKNTRVSYEDLAKVIDLAQYEDKMFYRTISPRHFEAAALRVCQILYEGNYSGILKPNVHYIPLKKDFSNFDDVIKQFNDPDVRHQITENAYNNLIASQEYSYKKFIAAFDNVLFEAGLNPNINEETAKKISAQMKNDIKRRLQITRLKDTVKNPIIRLFRKFPLQYQRRIKKIISRFGINPD